MKKILIRLGLAAAIILVGGLLLSNSVVFAEGIDICNGKVSGVTKLNNVNAGKTSFDSPDGGTKVSLKILGLVDGLAPAKSEYAACINKESGNYDHDGNAKTTALNYDYALKGWAWNDNGGFISFNCSGGKNLSGSTVDAGGNPLDYSCGTINYGVYINSVTGEVFGHAWSSTFGWMQFQGRGATGFFYGVKRDAGTGITTGEAWSQAGVYMDFSGLKLELSDKPIVADPDLWCQSKPWLCIQVEPDPDDLIITDPDGSGGAGVLAENQVKLADGQDGYYLHLYLRGADGKTALDPAKYNVSGFLNGAQFNWDDTVKIDQTFKEPINEVKEALDLEKTPWAKGTGAVTFKPLNYNVGDFVQAKKADGTVDPGHYVTNKKIASFAPTTASKVSYTTSTKPNYGVKNDEFLYDIGKGALELNRLVLKSITFNVALKETATGKILFDKPVYANGKNDLAFEFRPAIIVENLYANDLQDAIVAYRSIPINFNIGVKILSEVFKVNASVKGSAKAIFTLGYSKEETESEPTCDGNNPNIVKDFKFNFIGSDNEDLGQSLVKQFSGDLAWDAQAIAKIEECLKLDKAGQCAETGKLPCGIAKGANLYTQIEYTPVTGKTVKYYDNRLPRIAGDVTLNPQIMVRGNIFTRAVTNLRADTRVQSSGTINMNLIRDTINENLKKHVKKMSSLVGGDCKITALASAPSISDCGATYASFTVQNGVGTEDDENVLYFVKSDLTIDLDGGSWSKNWVIINDGGNIFLDSDIYNGLENENYLSFFVFREDGDDYFKTGNVYLAPCEKKVNNIQANIIADGTMFSYSGTKDGLDKKTGEPVWSYLDMIGSLDCQLYFEGTLHSDNTIGGADMDQGENAKDYLLGAGGKVMKLPVTLEERMKAQYYDLNYLRLFRLTLETSEEGFPIDQKCRKAWTAEDQKKLADLLAKYELTQEDDGAVCGEKSGCDPAGNLFQKTACDGVNPLVKYDPGSDGGGDLIIPVSGEVLAKGLDNTEDFDPVYIYYKAPMEGSFVFSKVGTASVGGN